MKQLLKILDVWHVLLQHSILIAASLIVVISGGLAAPVLAQAKAADTSTPPTNNATAPASLAPIPLRELYTKPGQMYLYSSSWSEVTAAQKSYGLTLNMQRPIGYVFSNSGNDTTPLYRLQQKSTGNWLVTSSHSEETSLVNSGTFTLQGSLGNIYTAQVFGSQPLNRYNNGKGWRLAYQSQDSSMKAAGYKLDGLVGYMLPTYYQIGAYYFGAYDKDANPGLLNAARSVYGRYPDPWAGVRDFHGDANSPWGTVTQNTQGWTGDFSYLKPTIGYYDDSQTSTLESQINEATSAGLSYFSFYSYWNSNTKSLQYNDAVNSFMAASNTNKMKFMISPCVASDSPAEYLSIPTSQFSAAATAFAAYTEKPNYLTTQDGRPMIFMCDVRGLGSGNATDINNFITQLRQAVEKDTGQNPFIMNESDLGLSSVDQYNGDGYTCLNMYGYISGGSYSTYVNTMNNYFSSFDNSGKPMMRCAMSGFNEAPRTNLVMPKSQVMYFKDDTKSQFPAAMTATLKSMQSQPASPIDNYMTVYAWNEWAEGGIIEPNTRDGNYYLNSIQTTFNLNPNM